MSPNDPIDPTNPNGYPEPADPRFKGWLDPEDPTARAQAVNFLEHEEAHEKVLLSRGWRDRAAIRAAAHELLQRRGGAPITIKPGVVAYSRDELLAGISALVASGARGDGR